MVLVFFPKGQLVIPSAFEIIWETPCLHSQRLINVWMFCAPLKPLVGFACLFIVCLWRMSFLTCAPCKRIWNCICSVCSIHGTSTSRQLDACSGTWGEPLLRVPSSPHLKPVFCSLLHAQPTLGTCPQPPQALVHSALNCRFVHLNLDLFLCRLRAPTAAGACLLINADCVSICGSIGDNRRRLSDLEVFGEGAVRREGGL